ncbi:MAG: zinc-binding dehydrogenase [Ignavibacteriaceae bacterium]|nr:zinc-binding dehydrogenase [Ignavibacteriaceae bacterium]
MKAAVLKKTGEISELMQNLSVKEVPEPEISSTDVIVSLNYSALNHRDIWITKGLYPKIDLPVIPGSDGCGTIVEKGSSVTEFNLGDSVIINPCLDWGFRQTHQSKKMSILGMPVNGTFAEYVKINKANVFMKPSSLTSLEAAAIPLCGLTAYRALFNRADLKNGENVLITGIGGGVASLAMIFAIAHGAAVYVTSGNNEKIELAKQLGAVGGANYNNPDWDKEILKLANNDIQVIVDGTGGKIFNKLVDIINYGGRIASYGATLGNPDKFALNKIFWKQITISGATLGSPSDFMNMVLFFELNKIKPVIDEVYDLQMIHQAMFRMNNGEQFGKIVIKNME